jgi:hypothetical protein
LYCTAVAELTETHVEGRPAPSWDTWVDLESSPELSLTLLKTLGSRYMFETVDFPSHNIELLVLVGCRVTGTRHDSRVRGSFVKRMVEDRRRGRRGQQRFTPWGIRL